MFEVLENFRTVRLSCRRVFQRVESKFLKVHQIQTPGEVSNHIVDGDTWRVKEAWVVGVD